MSDIKEQLLKDTIDPVSMKTTEIILDQMKSCVCKIHKGKINGSGFFIQVPYENQILRLLITNNHVLNEQDIMTGKVINISLNNEEIFKEIKIGTNRKKYTNKDLDVTMIEINNGDDIKNYLSLDNNILNNNLSLL